MNPAMLHVVAAEKPTQKTRPKKGKPIEIPVPKRQDFENALKRAAKPSTTRRSGK
jgi:hypothetical protein